MEIADHLYFTRVHCTVEVDTHFPAYNADHWKLLCEQFHPADEKNQYPFTFHHYVNKKSTES
jgi:dihydrofolate reductase